MKTKRHRSSFDPTYDPALEFPLPKLLPCVFLKHELTLVTSISIRLSFLLFNASSGKRKMAN